MSKVIIINEDNKVSVPVFADEVVDLKEQRDIVGGVIWEKEVPEGSHLVYDPEEDKIYNNDNQAKLEALEGKLQEIDNLKWENHTTFTYNGNTFAVDPVVALGAKARSKDIVWKSLNKLEDGVSNVYVEFDKSSFSDFCDAMYDHQESVWTHYENQKNILKAIYNDSERVTDDILEYIIEEMQDGNDGRGIQSTER